MSRGRNSFLDKKHGRIYVDNPDLAKFLAGLDSGGGVLQEDLTVSFQGGIGGAEENTVYSAGTSLEDVLRAILTGVQSFGLSSLDLLDGSTVLTPGLSNTKLFEAGTETDVTAFTVTVEGANLFESGTGSLSVDTGSGPTVLATGLSISNNTLAGNTDNTVTLGGVAANDPNDSTEFYAFDFANDVVLSADWTVTNDLLDGGNATAQMTTEHVLPAFVLNMYDAEFDGLNPANGLTGWSAYLSNPAMAAFIGPLFQALTSTHITKQALRAGADYDGHTFVNTTVNIPGQYYGHWLCVPESARHLGTPSVVESTLNTPVSNAFSEDYTYTLPIGPSGLNIIAVDENVSYRMLRFQNTSMFTPEVNYTLSFS